MTLIQPNKNSRILNIALLALIFAVAVSVILLISLYNQTVSLAHAADMAREDVKKIEAENSGLKRDLFALFDPDRVSQFAAERGMVTDKNPDYIQITKEWVAASHF